MLSDRLDAAPTTYQLRLHLGSRKPSIRALGAYALYFDGARDLTNSELEDSGPDMTECSAIKELKRKPRSARGLQGNFDVALLPGLKALKISRYQLFGHQC